MRVAIMVAFALALAGCEHMYGGMDAKLTEAEAIELVSAERVCLKNLEPSVSDAGSKWCVAWAPKSLPNEFIIGPEGSVCVDKRSRRLGKSLLFHTSPPPCPGQKA